MYIESKGRISGRVKACIVFVRALIKRCVRRVGWDIRRVGPASDHGCQLVAAMNHVGADVVFDIGANVGQFAQDLRAAGFKGRIVSFEPLVKAHRQLERAANHDSGWVVHARTAVGHQEGIVEVNVAGNSVSSSVLPMLDAHSSVEKDSAYVSSQRAPLVRLDSVAKPYLNPMSRCFIKIDTQGFEWQVLDGAVETLMSSRGVVLELSLLPLYDGQRLWRDFIDRMEVEGFTLWAIQEGFTDPVSGRSLQIDAVFLRQA